MDKVAVRRFSSLFLMKAYAGIFLMSVVAAVLLNTGRDQWELDAVYYACDLFITINCSDDSAYIYEYLYIFSVIVSAIYILIDILSFKSFVVNAIGYNICLKGVFLGIVGMPLILYFIFFDHRVLSIFIGVMGFNEISLVIVIFSIFHMYGVVSLYLYLIISMVQYKISGRV